ncbi:MAG: hypothetical protein HN846_03435 [Candidatus Pacebacteria bacterium]|jgi:hypothetical protein|nr:hypothetical protein [Candidatus Paceibacterota bacterium]MBT3512130.1 hypothetical protein [Candidatus Paceibacterota bacterium]MBT4005408.1 hypothetical protein [Candidatus Paceibacterota bacterium]MBT4359117.1 hypothetical protein [Candidatus Paceibacterota bacterium]MBT4680966.1 hypothetical protein [Candidatus Paceibacterota bacterium]
MKNKKIFIYLGIFSVTLLVLSAILSVLTPQQQEIPATEFNNTNINKTTSDFSNVVFVGQKPQFPEKLSVDGVTKIEDEDEIISKILLTYNLKPNSQSERYWTSSQGIYLHQDIYSKKYQLSLNTESAQKLSKLTTEQALDVATSEIKKIFPTLSFSPLENQIIFLKNSIEFYKKSTFEDADIINIPFSYTIDSYPLRYQKESVDPFMVMLNNEGQVVRIDFSPFFISTQTISKNFRIPIDQAVANINNNQGSIINFGMEQGTSADLSVIKSANLSSINIEYRYDEEIGFAYPFYRFSGKAEDLSGQTIQLEIITPAIETTPTE